MASVVAAVGMVVGLQGVSAVMSPGGERALGQVLVGGALGGLAFLGAAKLLHIEELDTLRALLPGGRRRRAVAGGLG